MQNSDNMNFWFAVILSFIISEFQHRGKRTLRTDGGRAVEVRMVALLTDSQMKRNAAGTLAISGKMTNFEGKKCWNYADIRTILPADLCHHERHRSGYQACCKARYAAFGGIRPHCKAVDWPKEFRKGIAAWWRFCVPASLRLVESGYKIMSKVAVKSSKIGYLLTLTKWWQVSLAMITASHR